MSENYQNQPEHSHDRNPWREYAHALERYIEDLENWYVQNGGRASTQDGGSNPTSPRPPKPTPPTQP